MNFKKVPGKNVEHQVKLYTLSTCGWCRKTKDFLKSLDVAFEYIDVDTLSGDVLQEVRDQQRKFNPRMSYPTIVIDGGKHVISGFKDDEIKKVLL